MGQTVYVDLLFMINFSMDFLCFFLCAKLMGRNLPVARAVAASAIGGIYSNVSLFIGVGRFAALVIDISVCVIMCALTFYKKGQNSLLPLYILVYFGVSMALGGFMTAIFNLLNRADIPLDDDMTDGISVWVFALLAAISAMLTLFGGRFFKRRSSQKRAEVSVTYGGKTVILNALADSGNLLKDPISGKPCIVADISALEGVIPTSVLRVARDRNISAIGRLPHNDSKNLRIVPIRTAGGEGMLVAFRPDRVTVDDGKGVVEKDAIIALSEIKGSADGSNALMPSELLI